MSNYFVKLFKRVSTANATLIVRKRKVTKI